MDAIVSGAPVEPVSVPDVVSVADTSELLVLIDPVGWGSPVLDAPGSEVSWALVTDGSSVGASVADRLVVVDGSSEMAVLEASVVTGGSLVLLPVGTTISEDVVVIDSSFVVPLLDTLVSAVWESDVVARFSVDVDAPDVFGSVVMGGCSDSVVLAEGCVSDTPDSVATEVSSVSVRVRVIDGSSIDDIESVDSEGCSVVTDVDEAPSVVAGDSSVVVVLTIDPVSEVPDPVGVTVGSSVVTVVISDVTVSEVSGVPVVSLVWLEESVVEGSGSVVTEDS